LSDDELRYITKRVQIDIIPPYTRIKRLARDFDSNEVVAGANTPNLRQLVEIEMDEEYKNHKDLRVAQYGKLYEGRVDCEDVEEFLENIRDGRDGLLARPQEYISTYIIGFQPDIYAVRNFVCLDTRSREVRQQDAVGTTPALSEPQS
jgi:hypothetical protein